MQKQQYHQDTIQNLWESLVFINIQATAISFIYNYFYILIVINNPVMGCGLSALRYNLLFRSTITLVMNSAQYFLIFFPLTQNW